MCLYNSLQERITTWGNGVKLKRFVCCEYCTYGMPQCYHTTLYLIYLNKPQDPEKQRFNRLEDPGITKNNGYGHMNHHNNQHHKSKGQMGHMPVFEKFLHGLQSVNPVVQGDLIFHQL